MDIRLNENLDFELDHRNDMPLVTGRAKFEQAVHIRLKAMFRKHIGSVNWDILPDLLTVEARRVAREMDELGSIANITVEPSEDSPNTIAVSVVYTTTDEYTFDISESN